MEAAQSADTVTLGRALLEFARAPGLYALRLGEPRLLFAQMDTVAAWALGRVPPGYEAHADELARAAVLFIQRACLGADAQQRTHYQVLGLTPEAVTPEALRQRYRALIRLAHPDMGVQGLAAHAATRVNQAYETLADPAQREAYDQGLTRQAAMAAARPRGWARRQDGHPAPGNVLSLRLQAALAPHSRSLRRGAGVALVLAVAGSALLWVLGPAPESRMLVVARAPQAPLAAPTPAPAPIAIPTPVSAAVQAPAATPRATPRPPAVATAAPAAPTPPAAASPAAEPAAPAALATPTSVTATTSTSTTTASLTASAAAPAAPAAQPAPQLLAVAAPRVWSVDALGARHYLTVLLSTLEKPSQARRANTQLADMRVQGSLLQPALGLMRQFPEIDVERMNWTDAERPGVLRVQGVVVLRASNPAVSESRTVNYRLSAEFRGTREGTVLAELELREGD